MYVVPTARQFPGRFVLRSSLSAWVLLLCSCAAPLQSERLLHNGATQMPLNRVVLMDVPFFPQQRYQCGPASLAMVLTHSGLRLEAEDLVPEVYLPVRQGSLQAEILAATRRHGRIPYLITPEMADLFTELQAGNPVLVLQNLGLSWLPRWHYAVVIGYDFAEQSIILHSGLEARYVMDMRVFERTWRRSDYWGMLVTRPDRIPATADELRWLQATAALEPLNSWQIVNSAYAMALQRWPSSRIAALGLGNSHYAMKNLDAAENAYRALLRLHPDSAEGHNNLAQVLLELGRLQEAEQEVRQAIMLDGDMQGVYEATLQDILAQRRDLSTPPAAGN